ncbi:MAG: prenyltransferase/squalene oxidase repeat-containing protein [Planctomycetota bacterium]|jgi:prenyltransferase beta subunit
MSAVTARKSLTARAIGRAISAVAAGLVIVWAPVYTQADKASPALAKYGKDVDQAIDKALAYLAGKQLPNGSFECPMRGNTAVTSLCVMAFLAKGYTPDTGPYGKVINRAIDHVLSCQHSNGLLVAERGMSHGPMYSHGISTLMLSEVSGMVTPERQEKIDKALSKALRLILVAQKVRKSNSRQQGGWRYHHGSVDSDISCTGWQLMALRSARNNCAPVPEEAIDKAVKYILGLRCPDGGFGYTGPGSPGGARTGTALLCLELCGKHGDPVTLKAAEWILKHPWQPNQGFFYYGLYYCSQGMFQVGGDYWEKWASRMYEMMTKLQRPDGSYPAGPGAEAPAGLCYSTAMSVLAMSVSYRQLPIYQR